jgi:hypothetical protein
MFYGFTVVKLEPNSSALPSDSLETLVSQHTTPKYEEEVLGRTNCQLSSDTTRTAWKTTPTILLLLPLFVV